MPWASPLVTVSLEMPRGRNGAELVSETASSQTTSAVLATASLAEASAASASFDTMTAMLATESLGVGVGHFQQHR